MGLGSSLGGAQWVPCPPPWQLGPLTNLPLPFPPKVSALFLSCPTLMTPNCWPLSDAETLQNNLLWQCKFHVMSYCLLQNISCAIQGILSFIHIRNARQVLLCRNLAYNMIHTFQCCSVVTCSQSSAFGLHTPKEGFLVHSEESVTQIWHCMTNVNAIS